MRRPPKRSESLKYLLHLDQYRWAADPSGNRAHKGGKRVLSACLCDTRAGFFAREKPWVVGTVKRRTCRMGVGSAILHTA